MVTAAEKTKRKTARRGNGEGSIYQRGDGRWCASVVVGRDENQRWHRKVVYGWTKGEVQEKLAKLLPQKQDGTLSPNRRETVGEYIDRWLENNVRPNRRLSTYQVYAGLATRYIKPIIGGLPLAKLAPANVESFYASLERAGKSPKLRQMIHAVLRRALG